MTAESELPPGAEMVRGRLHYIDQRGRLVDKDEVKGQHLLRDELVRRLFAAAEVLHQSMVDFRTMAFAEVQDFQDLVDQEYGASARPGGEKGNVTLKTYDGLMQVIVQVADLIRFETTALQSCKRLVDEYIADASADSDADLRTILIDAFRTNKAGQINRAGLLRMLGMQFKDPRLIEAMRALKDSIEVDRTKTYMRFQSRDDRDANWRNLSLDLATA